MRGIKPEEIPVLVARDVEMVKREAKIVINISSLNIQENSRPGLGIIAVIGPGEFQGRHFEETVLCEIGLGQSRPYHEARKPEEKTFIQYRRKWFSLSEEQYLIIAPQIFRLLQELTDKRVNNWKCGPKSENPFRIRVPRNFWYRHGKTLFQNSSWKPALRGARFAVSLADKWLFNDIFWAELNINFCLKRHLIGFARFIDLYLSVYKKNLRKNDLSRRFLKLKKVQEINTIIHSSSLSKSPYLLIELLGHLPGRENNRLWPYISSQLIPWDGRETRERIIASRVLPDPELRLGKIQLRIETGLDGRNKYQRMPKKRDHIVFEVYPKLDS